MFKIIYIISSIVYITLIGCGINRCQPDMVNYDWREINSIDNEFEPYIELFEEYYGYDNDIRSTIGIGFTDKGLGLAKNGRHSIAKCFIALPSKYSYIVVDINKWDEQTEEQKEIVMLHELHHCVFKDMEHNGETLDNGCPASLMRSYVFTTYEINRCYRRYFDYYLREITNTL